MQSQRISHQSGVTLIESLVAIVVVALGLLGILGLQLRTLTDTRTSVYRVQAIRLVEDLGERLRVQPNALGDAAIDNYLFDWDATLPGAIDCSSTACNADQLAQYDARDWRLRVSKLLPAGQATVFQAPGDNKRQIGVMISWRENERSNGQNKAEYNNPIDATLGAGGVPSAAACRANATCHLEYIPIGARCQLRQPTNRTLGYSCPSPGSSSNP